MQSCGLSCFQFDGDALIAEELHQHNIIFLGVVKRHRCRYRLEQFDVLLKLLPSLLGRQPGRRTLACRTRSRMAARMNAI